MSAKKRYTSIAVRLVIGVFPHLVASEGGPQLLWQGEGVLHLICGTGGLCCNGGGFPLPLRQGQGIRPSICQYKLIYFIENIYTSVSILTKHQWFSPTSAMCCCSPVPLRGVRPVFALAYRYCIPGILMMSKYYRNTEVWSVRYYLVFTERYTETFGTISNTR